MLRGIITIAAIYIYLSKNTYPYKALTLSL